MKKLIIAFGVAAVVFIGAFTVVGVGSSGSPAVAQTGETDAEAAVPQFVDEILDGLVDAGIMSESLADEIRTQIPGLIGFLSPSTEEGGESQGFNFDEYFGEHEDNFDSPEGTEGSPFDRFPFREFDGFGSDGFDFFGPDGFPFEDFSLPDGFDLEGLIDQFDSFEFPEGMENFTFKDFEFPEGFQFPHEGSADSADPLPFPGHGFGFLFDGESLDGLSLEDLRDAAQDGTLEDLIDTDKLIVDVEEMLDKAVAEGDLTQDQADAMLERMTRRIESFESGEFRPFGRGGKGPRGFGDSGPHPFRPGIAEDAKASV